MKTLLVLRHAKSSWKDAGLADHDRPLNKRGKRDGPRMGKLIEDLELVPDLIVSSTACRARKTAETVAASSHYRGEIRFDEGLYLAGPRTIVELVRELPDASSARVMLVGHNPGLEELIRNLTGEGEPFPTAALAQIELPIDSWSELELTTKGSLVHLWRPKELGG